MIQDLNTISYDFMTDFNGPKRHFPQPFYPSGLFENDKPQYNFGPESSKYPTLTLPCKLYDERGNTIPDGFYMVVLSDDMKNLLLYQSNILRARVKVVKLIEKMYTQEELNEESEIIGRMQTAKMNNKLRKYRKAEEDLVAFKQRAAAESYAEILDSGKGYYTLKYRHDGKTATGIIQK